jgi:peroxiredoxin family protein/rhodanese-related sulfurtransferase/TusA-related sulfurtransferase
MAENLHNKGLKVTVIEKLEQVMPPFDPEMANAITRHLKMKGISFKFGKGVESFDAGKSFAAVLEGGERINCDMVVLAIGVSPDTTIAKDAGLLLNTTGAIIVDSKMMTSDENIFAIGDAVTVENPILGDNWQVALAGPASRQARIAADVISGMDKRYNGTIGTSIVKIFDITAASTGCSEKLLKRAGRNYKKVYTNVPNHVSYYPGARPMSMKLLFDADNGAVLGAQIVGVYGVDRRIDVIATAIAGKIPADKLKNLELAYAPPYGAAKDPVNMLGFMAENTLNGMSKTVHFDEVAGLAKKGAIIIDVRTAEEYMAGRIDGSINIDLNELRGRISEIPRDKPLITYCQIGFRGYLAERILRQKGFDVSNLSGGYLTYIQAMRTDDMPVTIEEELPISDTMPNGFALRNTVKEIDACGLSCPGPIKKTFEAMDEIAVGERITIKATDPGFASDITSWCKMSGNRLIKLASDEGIFSATIERGTVGDATNGRENMTKDRLTLVVFSEKLDKVMAAFIIATGAVASGKKVSMFFTFWGLNALRKKDSPKVKKTLLHSIFAKMMPKGADKLKLSNLDMAGIGTSLMKRIMREKRVESLSELIESAKKSKIKLIACQMTMDVMGIAQEELLDGVEVGGVAKFLEDCDNSGTSLFVS